MARIIQRKLFSWQQVNASSVEMGRDIMTPL